ncbi:hypothetical protein GDO81_013879 [Engystomops pustulosus]|uniref:Uncharacterized protein n=1 Tax=Engystomops pustulosus TaxID=76066 RepID=A0AAV7B694_ENGPU|nr:hypothetical protein GDO81_013879 [Engystomops pustulosus]
MADHPRQQSSPPFRSCVDPASRRSPMRASVLEVDPPAALERVPASSVSATAPVPTTCGPATAAAAPDEVSAASASISADPVSSVRCLQAIEPATAVFIQADDLCAPAPADTTGPTVHASTTGSLHLLPMHPSVQEPLFSRLPMTKTRLLLFL